MHCGGVPIECRRCLCAKVSSLFVEIQRGDVVFTAYACEHGAVLVHKMAEFANIEITPLAGTLIAKKGAQGYGPVEKGIFRFEGFPDKSAYPRTHLAAARTGLQQQPDPPSRTS